MFIYSFSFKKFEETTEDQNNSEMIEGKNQKSLEKPKEFKERCVFRNSFLLLAFIQKNISIFTKGGNKTQVVAVERLQGFQPKTYESFT